MRRFMISGAAITAVAALLTSAPTRAEINYGPVKNGNQCFYQSPNASNSKEFGYWKTCPQAASAAATRSASTSTPVRRKKPTQ
jgi:hypothetical protein